MKSISKGIRSLPTMDQMLWPPENVARDFACWQFFSFPDVYQNFSNGHKHVSQQQRPLTALGWRVLERSLRRVAAERAGVCRWIGGSWWWPVSATPPLPSTATATCLGGEPRTPPTIQSSTEQMFHTFRPYFVCFKFIP